MKPDRILFFIVVVLVTLGCNTKNSKEKDINRENSPEWIPGTDVVRYWDGYDFKDTLSLKSEKMIVWMNSYIHELQKKPNVVAQSLNHTLDMASKDSAGYTLFTKTLKAYMYDPNSPYRNDEWYIHVIKHIIESDQVSATNKERAGFTLDMLMKNRIGEKAIDFNYTLASGKTDNLYNLNSKYILIFFYNPGCENCQEIMDRMKGSEVINRVLSAGILSVLAFYPDEDIREWKSYQKEIPSAWINSYDKNQTVTNKKLYDLKAIPSLYLLNQDKKVLLKDADFGMVEKYLYENNALIMQ